MHNIKAKLFTIALAVLLILCILTGVLSVLTDGFKDWARFVDTNVSESEQLNTMDTPEIVDENNNEMISGEVYQMPSNIKFTSTTIQSTLASNGVTLQADIKPVTAYNQSVDWSVRFSNPNEEWALGKDVNNYIKVTPLFEGSTSATVECLDSFGSAIDITVVSRENSEAFASCKVDFFKKIIGINYRAEFQGVPSPHTIKFVPGLRGFIQTTGSFHKKYLGKDITVYMPDTVTTNTSTSLYVPVMDNIENYYNTYTNYASTYELIYSIGTLDNEVDKLDLVAGYSFVNYDATYSKCQSIFTSYGSNIIIPKESSTYITNVKNTGINLVSLLDAYTGGSAISYAYNRRFAYTDPYKENFMASLEMIKTYCLSYCYTYFLIKPVHGEEVAIYFSNVSISSYSPALSAT